MSLLTMLTMQLVTYAFIYCFMIRALIKYSTQWALEALCCNSGRNGSYPPAVLRNVLWPQKRNFHHFSLPAYQFFFVYVQSVMLRYVDTVMFTISNLLQVIYFTLSSTNTFSFKAGIKAFEMSNLEIKPRRICKIMIRQYF